MSELEKITSIRVRISTREALKQILNKGESYDSGLRRLLDLLDNEEDKKPVEAVVQLKKDIEVLRDNQEILFNLNKKLKRELYQLEAEFKLLKDIAEKGKDVIEQKEVEEE